MDWNLGLTLGRNSPCYVARNRTRSSGCCPQSSRRSSGRNSGTSSSPRSSGSSSERSFGGNGGSHGGGVGGGWTEGEDRDLRIEELGQGPAVVRKCCILHIQKWRLGRRPGEFPMTKKSGCELPSCVLAAPGRVNPNLQSEMRCLDSISRIESPQFLDSAGFGSSLTEVLGVCSDCVERLLRLAKK